MGTEICARGSFAQTEFDTDPTYELETLVCARVLFNVRCMAAIEHSLEPYHFSNEALSEVYQAAQSWHREHGNSPPVGILLQAFDPRQKHEIDPTEWLLRMHDLSRRLTIPLEAQEAARLVIEAWFSRQRYSFRGSTADEIAAVLQDHRTRMDLLDARAKNADELLTFYDPQVSGTRLASYVVKRLIPAGSTCALHGPSGSGKTLVAAELSCCVAAGRSFHGHRVDQGGVLYVCLEGRSDFPKRLQALATMAGEIPTSFAWLKNNVVLSSDVANDMSETLIVDASKELEKRSGLPTRLIVIDTLARALAGMGT